MSSATTSARRRRHRRRRQLGESGGILPYGETLLGSYAHKRYRFAGRERDEESGLDYSQARYYAPWLGRWISPDPVTIQTLGADLNPYAYVSGSPIGSADLSGLDGAAPAASGPVYDYTYTPDAGVLTPASTAGASAASPNATATIDPASSSAPAPGTDSVANTSADSASAAPPTIPVEALPSAPATPPLWRPQTAGTGAVAWYDSAARGDYLEDIHDVSQQAGAEIEAARSAGDLQGAERAAMGASAFRNAARTETQQLLSPGGQMMSEALEGERSWATMFNKYGGTNTFETYAAIAEASGRSSKLVTRLATGGRYRPARRGCYWNRRRRLRGVPGAS